MTFSQEKGAPAPGRDPVEDFFDGDYPAVGRGPSVNLDEAALSAGVLTDIPWYVGRARARGGRVLDVGAGSGRMAIPLALHGVEVVAVEPNDALRCVLERFAHAGLRALPTLGDVPDASFDTALLAHGVLTSVIDPDEQQALLTAIGSKLAPGGELLLDLQNPMKLGHQAVTSRPTWIRVHPDRGTRYVRVAGMTAPRFDQTLEIFGRYEEDGAEPRAFSLKQKLVYPHELRMMVKQAGLVIDAWAGDVFGADPAQGTRWFLVARKPHHEDAQRPSESPATWIPRPPDGVSATSLLTAAARTRLPFLGADAPFDDPHAMRLSGQVGLTLLARAGGASLAPSILARALFFDAQTREALDAGLRQVVMLGAGMCTRSLRIPALASAKITLVDHPSTLAHRRALLADTDLQEIDLPLDLANEAAWEVLRASVSSEPTLVLAEGLLPYLSTETSARFLGWMADALHDAGSFVFDTLAPNASVEPSLAALLSDLGTAMRATPEAFILKPARHQHEMIPLRHPEASFGLPLSRSESTTLHRWIPG